MIERKKEAYSYMKEIISRIRRDIRNYWQAAIAIAVYTVLVNIIFHAFCPMVIMTGFPCPGCGMTRSLFYLATGRFIKSIQMNPMGIPIACIFLYFCWNRYIKGKKAKGIIQLILIALVLLLAVYAIRMYRFFPDRIPYVYNEGNVFARFSPYYEQILYELGIL